jgi:hypothetical protein
MPDFDPRAAECACVVRRRGTELDSSACLAHSRECACVAMQTEQVVSDLTFDLQRKLYGRVVTRDQGVAWPRCKVCGGSGVDRRP